MKISNFLKKKKSGSALFIFIMIFFGIFIIAFGSAYAIFLNINKMSNSADNLRAYYAAKAGMERAKYEAIKNNYNFSGNCNLNIFSETLSNDSAYSINCTDNNFYSVGTYNNSQIALKIDGIDIMEECSQNYLNGSLCGGGKLFKADGIHFIVSPPDCDQGFNCNNDFSGFQNIYLPWDTNPIPNFYGATNADDGLDNIGILDPQSNQALEAAKFCDDATFNGYNDWYLPAKNQLSYFNSGNLYYQYYGFDSNQKYWSSTEIEPGQPGFCFAFLNGEIIEDKTTAGSVAVRCIRNIPDDNLKAYYAAKAGMERAKYEAIKNNYNFSGNCNLNIFSETLSDDSAYSINCTDNNFYSVGTYNNSQIALKIDGINILEECSQNYLNGSLCGGGKLFKADNGTSFVVSPPNCTDQVSCDNDFNNIYFLFYHWDMDPPMFFGATNMDDGLDNIGVLDPQSRQNLEAARFCDEAMFNGYDDWYLPAINQFSYFSDNDVYYQYYGFDINQIYWSSTEFDPGQPNIVFVFSNGNYNPEDKNRNDLVVRCIRNVP